jgi:hypothetical protein
MTTAPLLKTAETDIAYDVRAEPWPPCSAADPAYGLRALG